MSADNRNYFESPAVSEGKEEFKNGYEEMNGSHNEPFITERKKEILMPQPLERGAKVAFITPASSVREEYVIGAMNRFIERGYQPVLMPHALGPADGSFASSKGDRLMDMVEAIENPEIKAIFCNRGGYGCVQMLSNFSCDIISSNPKWIIGFSDVSALLALWYTSKVGSIHGPMAKHLTMMPEDDPCTNALFNLLETGGRFDYLIPTSELNRPGKATGVLRGGNFAVLNGLAATPYDILDIKPDEDVILFFEDISEPIYAIERMLWRLNLSGTLSRVKGLIFGQFTEYKPDKNFNSMEEMISYWLDRMLLPDIPIVFNFPLGHVDLNYPLVVGATVDLEVAGVEVSIRTANIEI